MSRHHSFSSSARAIIRAAAQAERARQAAYRRDQAANLRAYRQAEREAKADEKEAARQYLVERAEEADEQTAEITDRETAISSLLHRGLNIIPIFDFKEVYEEHTDLTFDSAPWLSKEPTVADFLPKRPGILVRLWSKSYAEKLCKSQMAYEEALAVHLDKMDQAQRECEAAAQAEQHRVDCHNQEVDRVRDDFLRGEHDAVIYFFRSLINKSLVDDVGAISAEVGYARDSLHLVVDLEIPDYSIIPEELYFKYVKSGDKIEAVMRNPTKRKALYGSLVCQVALKCVDTVFRGGADFAFVECLTLNGMLDAIDPATGQNIRVCLLSVRVTRDDFSKLNLRQVQPEQCLKTLKASVSRSPAELLPVKPILELDMLDPRFVDSSDVLSGLDNRANLMDLSPNEFENLITNLFAKMGLDTRQTQASRDGGVDCVAFDQRPIFGGKVVIQAKRYKHTVGVSAVRDLYGTIQNEGASKGILVTTSGYGKASFEFAKGKPLELLDGGNLLHLLMEYASIDAKIVIPESWQDFPAQGQ